MPEPHIEDIMTLTRDIFETGSNVLLILSQELLDRKPLQNFQCSNVTINCDGQLHCLYEKINVKEWSERPLCFQNHALNQHYILHNCQLTQLTNIYRPKPQLMLLLACAHWEFPNIEKVWCFASRRGMLALFILADGQSWATVVFDPLKREDTKQMYRWEVRTGNIWSTKQDKAEIPKRIQQ